MRILMDVQIPHEPFNSYVRDGSIGSRIQNILEATKPEHVYFVEREGKRGALMIVDLPKPSAVPALAEPWFLNFQADVRFHVCMTPQDLDQAGLDAVGKKWA